MKFLYGRWLGRRNVISAGSHGLTDEQGAIRVHARAGELRGTVRDGFVAGVGELRPDWAVDLT